MGFLLLVWSAGLWADRAATPEGRAVAYLAREVPRWSAENKCYSCHNNGDAARALYAASRLGYLVSREALDDTSRWLARPERWDHNGGDTPNKDRGLARIQFAAALAAALDAGLVKERPALAKAAELVAEHQRKDGSWQIAGADNLGAPATYGTALATSQARRILLKADPERYREAINRGGEWLETAKVKTVLDAAAVLLGLDGSGEPAAAQRRHCLELIRKGQGEDGGWGPYVTSPSEVFDTAVVVLALSRVPDEVGVKDILKRGRGYLVAAQLPEGNWPETTRPSGAESYAERLSTAGWATLALLATRPE
jgi:hypothetical protein